MSVLVSLPKLLSDHTPRYLSAEQRLNYLVKVDDNGKLVWARSEYIIYPVFEAQR